MSWRERVEAVCSWLADERITRRKAIELLTVDSGAPLVEPPERNGERDCVHGARTCRMCDWIAGYPSDVLLTAGWKDVR